MVSNLPLPRAWTDTCRLNYFTLDVIGDMGFSHPMGFLQAMSDNAEA